MSTTANGCVRCDRCGRISRHRLGEYVRPDGSAGYINSKGRNAVEDFCDECEAAPRPNFWTEAETFGNIELPRCIHGEPRNVFCGKCEN